MLILNKNVSKWEVNLLFQNLGIQFNSLDIHKEPRLLLILAILVECLLVESN